MRKGAWGRTIPDRSRRESHVEVLVCRGKRHSSPGESPVGRVQSLTVIAASSERETGRAATAMRPPGTQAFRRLCPPDQHPASAGIPRWGRAEITRDPRMSHPRIGGAAECTVMLRGH